MLSLNFSKEGKKRGQVEDEKATYIGSTHFFSTSSVLFFDFRMSLATCLWWPPCAGGPLMLYDVIINDRDDFWA